ncbi:MULTISPECIES: hypothetical protein [Chryseobacterium]|uniref:Uncharacterized protein n=1 Tax=Chryseobacterium endophyticum TaxID=1854762 RepID=A0AAU6WUD4_9FLAO
MFFNSRYIIEFYKPKQEVLAGIESRLAKKLLDWDKSFQGRVTANGFKVKYAGWNASPEITGDFRKDEDDKEKLWLDISSGPFHLLGLLIATVFFFLAAYVLTLFIWQYFWLLMLIFYALYIQFIRIQWISCKDEFLQLLKNSDKLCTIFSLK